MPEAIIEIGRSTRKQYEGSSLTPDQIFGTYEPYSGETVGNDLLRGAATSAAEQHLKGYVIGSGPNLRQDRKGAKGHGNYPCVTIRVTHCTVREFDNFKLALLDLLERQVALLDGGKDGIPEWLTFNFIHNQASALD